MTVRSELNQAYENYTSRVRKVAYAAQVKYLMPYLKEKGWSFETRGLNAWNMYYYDSKGVKRIVYRDQIDQQIQDLLDVEIPGQDLFLLGAFMDEYSG